MRLISIGKLSIILGVSVCTLRRWHNLELLVPDFLTAGSHRRYDLDTILKRFKLDEDCETDKTLVYARVSSHDQKEQLLTQALRMEQFCDKQGWVNRETITDLGSGLNFKKKGLIKLVQLILNRKITRLILTTKDRLLRFGTELLFQLCEFFRIKVVILDAIAERPKMETLAEDLVEIITVFASRVYGARSRKNLKEIAKKQV